MEALFALLGISILVFAAIGVALSAREISRATRGSVAMCFACNAPRHFKQGRCGGCGALDTPHDQASIYHAVSTIADLQQRPVEGVVNHVVLGRLMEMAREKLATTLHRVGCVISPDGVLKRAGLTQPTADPRPTPRPPAEELVAAPPVIAKAAARPVQPRPAIAAPLPRFPQNSRPAGQVSAPSLPLAERMTRLLLTLGVSGLAVAAIIVLSAHGGEYSPGKMLIFSLLTAGVFAGGLAMRKWLSLDRAGTGFMVLGALYLPLNATAARVFGVIEVTSLLEQWGVALLASSLIYGVVALLDRSRVFALLMWAALCAGSWSLLEYASQHDMIPILARDLTGAGIGATMLAGVLLANRGQAGRWSLELPGGETLPRLLSGVPPDGMELRGLPLRQVLLFPLRSVAEVALTLLTIRVTLMALATGQPPHIENFALTGGALGLIGLACGMLRQRAVVMSVSIALLACAVTALGYRLQSRLLELAFAYGLIATLLGGIAWAAMGLRWRVPLRPLWRGMGALCALALLLCVAGFPWLEGQLVPPTMRHVFSTAFDLPTTLAASLLLALLLLAAARVSAAWRGICLGLVNAALFTAAGSVLYALEFSAESLLPLAVMQCTLNGVALATAERKQSSRSLNAWDMLVNLSALLALAHGAWRLASLPESIASPALLSLGVAVGFALVVALRKLAVSACLGLLLPVTGLLLLRHTYAEWLPDNTNPAAGIALLAWGLWAARAGLRRATSARCWTPIALSALGMALLALAVAPHEAIGSDWRLDAPISVLIGSLLSAALLVYAALSRRAYALLPVVMLALLPCILRVSGLGFEWLGALFALSALLWQLGLLRLTSPRARAMIAAGVLPTLLVAVFAVARDIPRSLVADSLRPALAALTASGSFVLLARSPRREAQQASIVMASLLAGFALTLVLSFISDLKLVQVLPFGMLAVTAVGCVRLLRGSGDAEATGVPTSVTQPMLTAFIVSIGAGAALVWLTATNGTPFYTGWRSALGLAAVAATSAMTLHMSLRVRWAELSLGATLGALAAGTFALIGVLLGEKVPFAWFGLWLVVLALPILLAGQRCPLPAMTRLCRVWAIGLLLLAFLPPIAASNETPGFVTSIAIVLVATVGALLSDSRRLLALTLVAAHVVLAWLGEHLSFAPDSHMLMHALLIASLAALSPWQAWRERFARESLVIDRTLVVLGILVIWLQLQVGALALLTGDAGTKAPLTLVLVATSQISLGIGRGWRWLSAAAGVPLSLASWNLLSQHGSSQLELYLIAPALWLMVLGCLELRRGPWLLHKLLPGNAKIALGLLVFFGPSLLQMLVTDSPGNASWLFGSAVALGIGSFWPRSRWLFFGSVMCGLLVLVALLMLVVPFHGMGLGWWIALGSLVAIGVAVMLERRINAWLKDVGAQARARMLELFAGWV